MVRTAEIMQTLTERYPLLPKLKGYEGKWSYDYGVVLMGVKHIYEKTKNKEYFSYIKNNMDLLISNEGEISGYNRKAFNLDNINNGKVLFILYRETVDERYKRAMDTLYSQLLEHPRTSEGAFWHKKIYPHQIWLDGLYMCAPFYAEYSLAFLQGRNLDDAVRQYEICYEHTLDKKSGLLCHAWDEAQEQEWCDKDTGKSPHAWGRAMGWYMMSLSDIILMLPEGYDGKNRLKAIFRKCADAIVNIQDKSGVWYQVLDQSAKRGNYLEASASCMFTAALARGVSGGFLDKKFISAVQKAWNGIQNEFVIQTKEGWVNLMRNCQVAGLGGDDKRDGTYAYYLSEPIITNDLKGYGAFLQAAAEIEDLEHSILHNSQL